MRCKPLPGPREGLNPLAAFERHLEPLCSRYCGPSAMSCTEVFDEPAPRSIESRSSEETSQAIDPPLSRPRCGGDGAVSQLAAGHGGPQRYGAFVPGTAPARCAIMHRARARFCVLAEP